MAINFPTPPGNGKSRDETKPSTDPTPEPEPEPISNDEPSFGDSLSAPELRQAIREYAEWCVDHYDAFDGISLDGVDIQVSNQMKRAAGKAGGKKDLVKGGLRSLRMRFALKAYQKWGWSDDWTGVIRHELVHIWQYQVRGDGGHGPDFHHKADQVDAPRHCPKFSDYKYEFFCKDCGEFAGGRYQRSKTVKNPDKYRSGCCKAPLRVEAK